MLVKAVTELLKSCWSFRNIVLLITVINFLVTFY